MAPTAYTFDAPRFYSNTQWKEPLRSNAPVASGQTYDQGQFVVVQIDGTLAIASTTPATVSGLADEPAAALVNAGPSSGGGYSDVTGASSPGAGSQVQPFAPGAVGHYVSAKNGQPFEISLKEAWPAGGGISANDGTAIGLVIDATTGLWVASTAAAQKIGTITQGLEVVGNYLLGSGPGGGNVYAQQYMGFASGDTGCRVVISLTPTSVSP